MSVRFYADENLRRSVVEGVRRLGIDVLTAVDDDRGTTPDPQLLDRATELGRAMVTQDQDFLVEATQRQRAGIPFGGVVFAHQDRIADAEFIEGLELISFVLTSDEIHNQLIYLPF